MPADLDPERDDILTFFAELERVCPEATNGLAIQGPPPPMISVRERIALLRQLPNGAGVEAFLAAWYAAAPADPSSLASDVRDA